MERRGFTLIELLVVVAIIGLMASIIVASVNTARQKAKYAAAKQLDANFYHNLGDSLVGQWLFEESGATNGGSPSGVGSVQDTSGYGNNGTPVGSPAWANNTPFGQGYGMQFNGSNCITTVKQPISSSGSGSISTWAYITDKTGLQYIITASNNIPDPKRIYVGVLTSGVLAISLGQTSDLSTGTEIPLNAWNFIVLSWNNANNNYYVFVNGSQVAQGTFVGIAGGNSCPTIGGYAATCGAVSCSYPTRGYVDNVRIYDRALDTAEIQKLYVMDAPKHGYAFIGRYAPDSYYKD